MSDDENDDMPAQNDDEETETVGRKRVAPDRANANASKRTTATPVSEREAKQMILDYMKQQNRPYSHVIIGDNLRGAVKKSSVAKICDELVSAGALMSKTFGKSVLYLVKQTQHNGAALAELESKLQEANRQRAELSAAVSAVRSELAALTAEPDDELLQRKLNEVNAENERTNKRLADLIGPKSVAISAERATLAQSQFNYYLAQWKVRKGYCMNIINDVCDGDKKMIAKVMSDRGIESDEDCHVDIAKYKALERLDVPKYAVKGALKGGGGARKK